MHWDALSLKSSNRVDQVPKVAVLKSVVELLVDVPQVGHVQLSLPMPVQQHEMSLPTIFSKWVTDLLCQFIQEPFEVQSVTVVSLVNLLDGSEDEFVLILQAECLGGHEDIPHFGSSLSGVGIQREHGVKVGDEVFFEDGVFGSDGFGHDGLEVLFELFPF